jgi:uncharacterized protein
MLVRLLVLIVLVALVVMALRRLRAAGRAQTGKRVIDARTVRCAHCQVYFPSSEAVRRDGAVFCSEAHAAAGHEPP